MSKISFVFLGAICFIFAPKVSAMECNLVGGITTDCPTGLNNRDQVFCCEETAVSTDVFSIKYQRCCDIEEFMKTNTGLIAGVVIAAVVILLIITLCCCCFCSCCCLAKRRVQRGHVLYGPVDGAQVITTPTPTTFQVVHPPPATQAYSPPSYNPNYAASQPALNPYYK